MFGFDFGGFGMGGGQDDFEDDGNQQIQNTRLYEVLGVKNDATPQQITAAFEKLQAEHKDSEEPDNFEEIRQAYEVLSNPKDREMYDQFGQGGPSQADIMKMMFGGQGGPKGPAQKQKSQPLKQLLQITLEQSYNGDIVQVPVKRYRLCKLCGGAGGADVKKCTDCKGQGHVVRVVPIGPGMMQQVAQPCSACQGQGQIIPEESRCKACDAKQVKQQQVTVEVKVPKGINNQQPIVVANQGHEIPDALIGDLILVVKILPHDTFTRNGNDLIVKKQILLIEAITGVIFNLNHLDKKVYTIQSPPKQIIADKSKKVVSGLGMPLFKSPSQNGNLIVDFHLIMPQKGSISPQHIKQLATILPGGLSQKPKDHHYELLQEFDTSELNANQQGGGNQEDEDDGEGQPQGIQCASQ